MVFSLKRLPVLLLILMATVAVPAMADRSATQPAKQKALTSFKGWELYAWREGDAWQYSLLEGSNETKTDEEIISKNVLLADIAAVKTKLAELDADEWVTLLPRKDKGELPSPKVQKELNDFCQEHNLNIHGGLLRRHEPASTKTTSDMLPTFADRTKFLNHFVTYRRTYETLDFDITYHNNSGGFLPAPSDWDIKIIATVPADEIADWIPANVKSTATTSTDWLKSVPTTLDLSAVKEWYIDGSRTIGINRDKRIVVYRSVSN